VNDAQAFLPAVENCPFQNSQEFLGLDGGIIFHVNVSRSVTSHHFSFPVRDSFGVYSFSSGVLSPSTPLSLIKIQP
jgi:hypothetical protein